MSSISAVYFRAGKKILYLNWILLPDIFYINPRDLLLFNFFFLIDGISKYENTSVKMIYRLTQSSIILIIKIHHLKDLTQGP